MRTIVKLEGAFTVDTLIFTIALELATRGVYLTWFAYQARPAKAEKFYRPEWRSVRRPVDVDQRARLAGGA